MPDRPDFRHAQRAEPEDRHGWKSEDHRRTGPAGAKRREGVTAAVGLPPNEDSPALFVVVRAEPELWEHN